jgi:putative addiction module component (TIGR02574 family)
MIPARLLDEVLALPPEERRAFALRVLETVDPPIPPELDEAHYQEVLRRVRNIDEGRTKPVPHDHVMARLAAIAERARGSAAG